MARRGPRWAKNEKVLARIALGERRIQSILLRHGIATIRTLEQKISDAGPNNQRIEPIWLTQSKNNLLEAGLIVQQKAEHTRWYHLPDAPRSVVSARLNEQVAVLKQIHTREFTARIGDALEIATIKALRLAGYDYFGGYLDLDLHDDSIRYRKEDPPLCFREHMAPAPVDFYALVNHQWLAIEVKNTREWIYPNSSELHELIKKSVSIDMIPVLVARRIAYVTMREILEPCGILAHQTYNQRYPSTGDSMAKLAKDKNLLGYHDIRLGNDPDARMNRFFQDHLPLLVSSARTKFDANKDILSDLSSGEISYLEFHNELRKRQGIYVSSDDDPDYDE